MNDKQEIKVVLTSCIGNGTHYVGLRTPIECRVYRPDGSELPWRLDLCNHSPTGLEWGFLGSGPAQLALALLADLLGDETALRYYQSFKRKVVARLPSVGWILSPAIIKASLSEIVSAERGHAEET